MVNNAHGIMYRIAELLCGTPEINVILCVNYISIKSNTENFKKINVDFRWWQLRIPYIFIFYCFWGHFSGRVTKLLHYFNLKLSDRTHKITVTELLERVSEKVPHAVPRTKPGLKKHECLSFVFTPGTKVRIMCVKLS